MSFSSWMIFFGAVLGSSHVHAFTLMGTGSDLKGWDTKNLQIAVNYTECPLTEGELNSAIDQAMNLWNSIPTSGLTLERAGSSETTPLQAFEGTDSSGPVIVCDPDLSKTFGESMPNIAGVGIAQVLGDRIVAGALILNADLITEMSSTTLALVIAHELGHVLGIGHSSDSNSVMYYAAIRRSELKLTQDDIDAMTYLYPREELGKNRVLGCARWEDVNHTGGSGGNPLFTQWGLMLGLCAMAWRSLRTRSQIFPS